MLTVFMILGFLLLGVLTYWIREIKTVLVIGFSSILGSLIIHGIIYLAVEHGKGQIVMWSVISVPILALLLYAIISLTVIIRRIFV